jgi:hypothetical protein
VFDIFSNAKQNIQQIPGVIKKNDSQEMAERHKNSHENKDLKINKTATNSKDIKIRNRLLHTYRCCLYR